MTAVYKEYSTRRTNQREPIPGKTMVRNQAGGYVFKIGDWERLDRFLILGSETSTYYASAKELTRENAECVLRCAAADGPRAVARVAEISESGRAPKNDSAIFALSLLASLGDENTRRAALAAIPRVCRIGTHLFHFAQYVDSHRGWGRGLRTAIGNWYAQKPAKDVAFNAVKYQSRDGWGHRDLLRLAHPKPSTDTERAIYYWITKGWESVGDTPHDNEALRLIWAFEKAKRATGAKEIVSLIRDYKLPREAIPTQFLKDPQVWEALLEDMPMTAMIRNLATMTRVGLIGPMATATMKVVDELGNAERIKRARVHPIQILAALKTYASGQSAYGGRENVRAHNLRALFPHGSEPATQDRTWSPVSRIVDALDAAFYAAFANVEPTGKAHLVAVDVSGSMSGGSIAGIPNLTPREAAAAMALVTMATEPNTHVVGFSDRIFEIALSPRQRLDDVARKIQNLSQSGTDCALPIAYAIANNMAVDVFVEITDGETYAGKQHVVQALAEYRKKKDAKFAAVATTATGTSIADPEDKDSLECVGFDTNVPALVASLARGEL